MNTSKTGRRSSWSKLTEPEMLVAFSAIVISLGALFVSIVQVQIMRQEQHTAVWPRLHVEQHYAQGRNLRLVLVNRGLGPAVIQDVRVSIRGEPKTSWTSVLEALAPQHTPRDLALNVINGRILSAGAALTPFSTADPTLADTMSRQLDSMVMQICYCSVYEQCWSMTRAVEQGVSHQPEEVRSCDSPSPNSFVD